MMSNTYTRMLLIHALTFFCFVGAFFLAGQLALAQNTGQGAPLGGPVQLRNPLQAQSITELLEGILAIVLVLAIPLLVFFIIYAGFMYVTAKGNPAKLETAHKALGYSILGGILIIGAFSISTIIKNLVNAFR